MNIFMFDKSNHCNGSEQHESYHGAFKTFRSASEFLIKMGYTAFYNDELSELFDEETISFIDTLNDKEYYIATIQEFTLHD